MDLENSNKEWLELTRHWLELKKTGTDLINDDVTTQFEEKALDLEEHLKRLSDWLQSNVGFFCIPFVLLGFFSKFVMTVE